MVRLVLEEGRTIASVNKEYNLGEGTVRSWIRQFEEECEKNPEIKETKDIYEENRILRKGNRLEQYRFIDQYHNEFGVRWLLARFHIYPNSYYNYRKNRKAGYLTDKEKKKQQILSIYYEYDGRPGYRMMVIFLRRRGIRLSRTTVLKYMRELKLRSVVIPQKSRYRKGDCYKKFNNLLKQDFTAIRPNEKWCTDFTYLYLSDGAKRYNCSIIDLYDKSVLATLNSKRIDAELAIQTLQIALDRNPVKGKIILHSDQGSQYTSRAFTEFCEGKGIQQSMSKAGCPYDNSPMESFYGTFKSEFIQQNRFETDQELNESTLDYVYGYYNQ